MISTQNKGFRVTDHNYSQWSIPVFGSYVLCSRVCVTIQSADITAVTIAVDDSGCLMVFFDKRPYGSQHGFLFSTKRPASQKLE